jgi:hypothetical protein
MLTCTARAGSSIRRTLNCVPNSQIIPSGDDCERPGRVRDIGESLTHIQDNGALAVLIVYGKARARNSSDCTT